jgi:hypothetical protein
VSRLHRVLSPALSVTGLGFLSAAAWSMAAALGMAAVGVSCLLVAYVAEGER